MELIDLPKNKDLTYIGYTTYRDKNQLFGIKRKDRRQHVYILGKSGTGKSVLMQNMIIQNIENGEGVCVVDPHGETVETIVSAIPSHRLKDVVYFNPADTDFHIGFNVLELIDPKYKHLVASGLMGIFTKIWANAWSARMEYILNNTILALLDTPGSTLLGIQRMLVDKDYRQKIISNMKDPVIKAFWVHEYEAWQDKFRNEAIAPIQNKVGQFLSTSIIRNVVGQAKSTINIFDIMNESKIFLVNVSKGRIGEDNSALLGGMIITKIQLAAMERVRIPEDERKDFYLYVDEFQNFVTESFASILSEARKYRLNLTVAHQYTAQLISDKGANVRDAVFGNVGTIIVFRVGADDAEFLEKEFEPEFTPQDIVNLPNYKIYLKLMIDGVTSRPFSAKTISPLAKSEDMRTEEQVIASSRSLYCRPRDVVEKEINDWSGMALGDEVNSSASGKFPAICSSCSKETMVPFKPEPGRPVYCRDCIVKIKAGELRPMAGFAKQFRKDEERFYKPLADLGIEFQKKDLVADGVKIEEGEGRYMKEDIARSVAHHENITGTKNFDKPPVAQPKIFGTIKRVFGKPQSTDLAHRERTKLPPPGENTALKEVLNKALSEKEKENAPVQKVEPTVKIEEQNTPPPISLSELKNNNGNGNVDSNNKSGSDRAASREDMEKLKDFISGKTDNIKPADTEKTKEVPEDVLKKILE